MSKKTKKPVAQKKDINFIVTDDLVKIADYIYYIVNGEIVLNSDKDILLSSWKKIHYRSGVLDEKLVKKLINIQENVFGCSGITKNFHDIENLLSEEISKENVKVENIDLDDILISLTKGE